MVTGDSEDDNMFNGVTTLKSCITAYLLGAQILLHIVIQ